MSEIVFPSTKAGNEVDRAVTAALSTIPGQVTQLDTRVTAMEDDVDDLQTLPAQVATIGSKIGDLSELETADKTDLVSAINEIKEATEDLSGDAADISYTDNQGLGSTNVQGALDKLGAENNKLYDYDTISCADLNWYSGNFNGYTYVSTYANMVTDYIDVSGYDSLNKVHITNPTTFTIHILCFTSQNASGGVAKIGVNSTSTESVLDLEQYGTKYIRLLCWDKPTQAQAMAETFSMAFSLSKFEDLGNEIKKINVTLDEVDKELAIPDEYFDLSKAEVSTNAPSALTVEKTNNGFLITCLETGSSRYAYCTIPNLITGRKYRITFDFRLTGASTSSKYPYFITIYDGNTYLNGIILQKIGMSGKGSITFTPQSTGIKFRMAASDMVSGNIAEIYNISCILAEGQNARLRDMVEPYWEKEVTFSTIQGTLRWHQGGINKTTGKIINSLKAIYTDFIKIYANDSLSALSFTNTVSSTVAYCIYDKSFVFHEYETSIGKVLNYIAGDYGYVRLTFESSNNIDKNSDNAITAVWNIVRKSTDYLFEINRQYIQNPIYSENCPDPCVVNGGDGYWYCFYTIGATGKFIRSANLIDWEEGEVFLSDSAIETLSALATSFWAPEIKKIGGYWMMYISAAHQGMFVLRSRNIWGKYEIVNNISSSLTTTTERIDACVEYDENGQLWIFWGSTGGICRAKLNALGTDLLEGEVPEKITPSDRAYGNGWEGVYLYRRNGYWYLFSSNGKYTDYTYNIRVVRSGTLAGSFVDKDGNTYLEGNATRILYSENGDEIYGPGHNGAIVVDKDNRTWMFFHAHILGDSNNQSRRPLFIGEVLWDEDGWPYFEGGKPSIKLIERPTF